MTEIENFLLIKGDVYYILGQISVNNVSVTDLMEEYHQSQLKPQEENDIQKYMIQEKIEYAKKCGCERCKEIINEYKAELTNKQKQ